MDKQTLIDQYTSKYRLSKYHSIKNVILERLDSNDIKFIDADWIHNLFREDGISPVVGIVLRNMIKERRLKVAGWKNSDRKECHHRPIRIFEVVR